MQGKRSSMILILQYKEMARVSKYLQIESVNPKLNKKEDDDKGKPVCYAFLFCKWFELHGKFNL